MAHETTSSAAAGPDVSPSYRGFVLFMLIVVYTFNFIDRQILSILAIPIQQELQVSDSVIGLMRGVAFAAFYSTLGVPIALLADRYSRVKIMTVALTVWSGMTALCGLATTPLQLFFARMGVGVGEAGGVAPAYSIVTDYHEPEKRAGALAAYSFGIPIGSAVGIIFAGIISQILDWRAAFIIIGGAGVLLAPVFMLTVKEPKRGQYDGPGARVDPAPVMDVMRTLLRKRSFFLLCLGAASSSIVGYGLFAWIPTFLYRSYSTGLLDFFAWLPGWMTPGGASPLLLASYFYGTIVFVGGIFGIWLGGYLGDRLGKSDKSAYARVPAFAFLAMIPFFVPGLFSPSLLFTFLVFILPTGLSLAWLGPLLSAFQHIVPPNMRVTASAIFLLINNLLGIALGDFLIGLGSDLLQPAFGDESLRYSLLGACAFYVLAATFLFLAAPLLKKDWEG